VDLGFELVSRFDSVNRARVTRVSHFPKADRAGTRVITNLENVRQFVMLIWMMCQSDLIRFLRSQRVLKLVKMTKKDPRTLFLVLECHVSGDHGQNATLSYDTYLRQTSVGIWGVTDCPLKYEVRGQYDDRNALLIDDLDNTGGEPEQSCKNNNQQQYMIMSTLRRAYPMLSTKLICDKQAWEFEV